MAEITDIIQWLMCASWPKAGLLRPVLWLIASLSRRFTGLANRLAECGTAARLPLCQETNLRPRPPDILPPYVPRPTKATVEARQTLAALNSYELQAPMLEKPVLQEQRLGEESGQALTPAYFYDLAKRRALHFAIPFVVVFTLGSLVTLLWPAKYLSQGTILVEAQQIPTTLVQPTVSDPTTQRIQAIQQRIMTRDNLLAIAKKYHLFTGWRQWLSGTQIVDFIRNRTKIEPLEQTLQKTFTHGAHNMLAFTVGFEHENPQIAMNVANELVTMILQEDVRARTGVATEATRFLDKEVQRLEGQVNAIDSQIAKLTSQRDPNSDSDASSAAKALNALRAELAIKSASFSDSHPVIQALKRRIKALEKVVAAKDKTTASGIDALESRRDALKANLQKATEKLTAARVGESLEQGQQSERLTVIEQPSLPQEPVSPNRKKLFAFTVILALMAGGGLVGALEMFDTTIHRGDDLFKLVDRHMVVAIPYISTHAEELLQKKKQKLALGVSAGVAVGLLLVAFFLVPVDVLFDKVMAHLSR